MKIEYSDKTLRLGRQSFQERYKRMPSDAELAEYIETFLKLGMAMIR